MLIFLLIDPFLGLFSEILTTSLKNTNLKYFPQQTALSLLLSFKEFLTWQLGQH